MSCSVRGLRRFLFLANTPSLLFDALDFKGLAYGKCGINMKGAISILVKSIYPSTSSLPESKTSLLTSKNTLPSSQKHSFLAHLISEESLWPNYKLDNQLSPQLHLCYNKPSRCSILSNRKCLIVTQ